MQQNLFSFKLPEYPILQKNYSYNPIITNFIIEFHKLGFVYININDKITKIFNIDFDYIIKQIKKTVEIHNNVIKVGFYFNHLKLPSDFENENFNFVVTAIYINTTIIEGIIPGTSNLNLIKEEKFVSKTPNISLNDIYKLLPFLKTYILY